MFSLWMDVYFPAVIQFENTVVRCSFEVLYPLFSASEIANTTEIMENHTKCISL